MSLRFRSFQIALRQALSVEVGNVPDSKVFSLIRDIVILLFNVRRQIPFMWPSNFVFFKQQQILLIGTKLGNISLVGTCEILKGLYHFE